MGSGFAKIQFLWGVLLLWGILSKGLGGHVQVWGGQAPRLWGEAALTYRNYKLVVELARQENRWKLEMEVPQVWRVQGDDPRLQSHGMWKVQGRLLLGLWQTWAPSSRRLLVGH